MASSKLKSGDKKKEKKSSSKSSTKALPAAKVPPQTFKSSEFVAESDNENNEAVGSEAESDSENDSLPSKRSTSKTKPNGKGRSESDSSEEQSESESESESEQGDEVEAVTNTNGIGKKSRVPLSSKSAANNSSTRTVSAPEPIQFKPPPGFATDFLKDHTQASQLFEKSRLDGKQIWYITAPASVPIDSIKDMSLRGAKSGKKVFSHNGNDYGFIQDATEDKTYTKIMIPNNSKDGYRTERTRIDQIFHLQQVVDLANGDGPSHATVPAKRPVRKQPKGLKMRYRPIGFATNVVGTIGSSSDDSGGDSDENDQGSAPKFQKFDMSEDEASDEDVVMEDAPAPASLAKKSKSRSKKSSQESVESGSSKRKHKATGDSKKEKKHKRKASS